MFKFNKDNFIIDCTSEEDTIIIPKEAQGIETMAFLGLNARVISFEGDCCLKDSAFVEMANLEILDCRAWNLRGMFFNLLDSLSNCPTDICIIVKDDYIRNTIQDIVGSNLIFTDEEFYEESLKTKKWLLNNLFPVANISDYDEDYAEKFKDLKGMYIPDFVEGDEMYLDSDAISFLISKYFWKLEYLRLPKIIEKEGERFGNKRLTIKKIHFSRKGNFIPSKFMFGSTIESLYIPDNFTKIAGFEDSKLEEVVFENFDMVTSVDTSFCKRTPYMEMEKAVASKESGIFVWKNVALDLFTENGEEIKLSIPKGVRIIANSLTDHWRIRVKELILGKDVKYIGEYAFTRVQEQSTISFPDGLLEIGNGAFEYNKFKTIELPESVKKVGNNAFKSYWESYAGEEEFIRDSVTYGKHTIIGVDAFTIEEEDLPFN